MPSAEQLVNEAQKFKCRLHVRDGRWHWSHGTSARSSNDHYGISFATAGEAAAHFLNSREGQAAKEMRGRVL